MSYQKLKTIVGIDECASREEVEKAEKEINEVLKEEDFAKSVIDKKGCQIFELYAEVNNVCMLGTMFISTYLYRK